MTEDEEEKCVNMAYLTLGIGFVVVGFILGCITVGVAHI